jgi:hypothetical protein
VSCCLRTGSCCLRTEDNKTQYEDNKTQYEDNKTQYEDNKTQYEDNKTQIHTTTQKTKKISNTDKINSEVNPLARKGQAVPSSYETPTVLLIYI